MSSGTGRSSPSSACGARTPPAAATSGSPLDVLASFDEAERQHENQSDRKRGTERQLPVERAKASIEAPSASLDPFHWELAQASLRQNREHRRWSRKGAIPWLR